MVRNSDGFFLAPRQYQLPLLATDWKAKLRGQARGVDDGDDAALSRRNNQTRNRRLHVVGSVHLTNRYSLLAKEIKHRN